MTIESTPRLVEQVVNKCVDKCIPYSVMFELTYMCNLNCRHCYVVIDNDDTELSMEEITEIINQLLDMGTFYLTFTGGEIFTRKDLLDIAMYAKKKGFLLTFMTNGTLITPEKIEEIKKRYKTVKGILSHLTGNMEYWTRRFGRAQHPTSLQSHHSLSTPPSPSNLVFLTAAWAGKNF